MWLFPPSLSSCLGRQCSFIILWCCLYYNYAGNRLVYNYTIMYNDLLYCYHQAFTYIVLTADTSYHLREFIADRIWPDAARIPGVRVRVRARICALTLYGRPVCWAAKTTGLQLTSGMADEPVCAGCKATSSLMWEKNKEGEVLCLECHSNTRQDSANTSSSNPEQPVAPGNETTAAGAQTETQHAVRRTRLRNAKGRYGKTLEKTTKAANSHTSAASSALGGNSTAAHHRKGGVAPGRRSLLKGKPNKTPTFAATVVTSDTILHKVARP